MIASPSDLLPLPARPQRARRAVGGRVASVAGRRALVADALGAVAVELDVEVPLTPGELVVVEGRLGPGGLGQARVLERWPAPLPAPSGEVARLAWGAIGRNLAARSRALAVVRAYFARAGFLEVDTPIRVRTPGLDANVHALRAHRGWLLTSPELHLKRLLVGGLPRIYELVHCSRADEQGRWHEPEFLMLEWYRAFADSEAVMADTEQLVAAVVEALAGHSRPRGPAGYALDVTPPFERITVRDAFRRYARVADAVDLAGTDPQRYFTLLVDAVEPALARRRRPVFLTHYPLTEAALARAHADDPTVAERFELYAGGLELCNGFGELTDPSEQRRRFVAERRHRRAAGQPVYPLDERFLAALVEGMPPSAGNALGLDRLIALALGAPGIAAVQAFPADRV